jgi:PAS domain S-box-containing protein
MPKKLAYENLEQRVKELDKEAAEHNRAEEALRESIRRRVGYDQSIMYTQQLTEQITERQRAGDALQVSEEKYSILVENSLTGIFIYQDGKYVFVNDRFAEIHGYEPRELLGKEHLTLVHPDEREVLRQIASKRLKGEAVPQQYEVRRLGKDGKTIWCEMMAGRIEYAGRPAIMGNIVDITERKWAEEALRESEERYRAALEACPDPIVVYDMEGKCSYINPAFTTVFGWIPEELIGKKLDYVPEENWSGPQLIIDTVLAGESFSGVESRRYTKDGDILDVSISAAIHLSRNGVSVGSVHFLRDITQRKRAEKALRQRKEELKAHARSLEEVNTALKVLLSRRKKDKAEHEEKVLANVKELILPYLKTLRNTRLDAKQMAYTSIIESHLNEIVSPFLRSLSSKYMGLTRREIQVASHVKEGKTNKEIAELFNVSVRAVEAHRENIRAKLGLKHQPVNLRSYLLSFE